MSKEAYTSTRLHDYPPTLFDGAFSLVQPRLLGGAVYKGADSYLRVGEREATMTEEIKTRSLYAKGFPVAKIIEHGEVLGGWYYTEESLGDEHFGEIFAKDYEDSGFISDRAFEGFVGVMTKYAAAAYGPNNKATRGESIRDISLFDRTKAEYPIDPELFEALLVKAEKSLSGAPQGLVSGDLGPFNILPNGVIDFEFLHTGPVGYDVYTAPLIGNYFPDTDGFRLRMLFRFTDEQLAEYYSEIDQIAEKNGHEPSSKYWNEFVFLKTIWAAARPQDYQGIPYDNEERERFWSVFRFNILRYAIDCYSKDIEIQPQKFPDIGVSGQW